MFNDTSFSSFYYYKEPIIEPYMGQEEQSESEISGEGEEEAATKSRSKTKSLAKVTSKATTIKVKTPPREPEFSELSYED
jgi:hypothetical protein